VPEAIPESDGSEGLVGNAVIVACVIGIIAVAALIVLTPRGREPFTQLWLKPWKLNLSNLSAGDPILDVLAPEADSSSMVASSTIFGNSFYVDRSSLRVGLSTDLLGWGPHSDFASCFSRYYSTGDTVWLGSNALYLDAVDAESYQMLFFEYPKTLYSRRVRFAFVVENDLGDDYEYRVNVSLAIGNSSSPKILQKVKVGKGLQKTCVIDFSLSSEEVTQILGPAAQSAKITAQLDTGEEVFFWIGSTRE